MIDLDKASIIRLVSLVVALVAYFGINIPENTVELVGSLIVSIVGLYTAYKNNYLFGRGEKQKDALKRVGLYEENK